MVWIRHFWNADPNLIFVGNEDPVLWAVRLELRVACLGHRNNMQHINWRWKSRGFEPHFRDVDTDLDSISVPKTFKPFRPKFKIEIFHLLLAYLSAVVLSMARSWESEDVKTNYSKRLYYRPDSIFRDEASLLFYMSFSQSVTAVNFFWT